MICLGTVLIGSDLSWNSCGELFESSVINQQCIKLSDEPKKRRDVPFGKKRFDCLHVSTTWFQSLQSNMIQYLIGSVMMEIILNGFGLVEYSYIPNQHELIE